MTRQSVCLVVFLLTGFVLKAQLLSTTPSFPKENATVTIIVDCSKGNKGLFNYANTNDVYVHTGVITDKSVNAADWKYVKFNNFNAPDPVVKAELVSPNIYHFVIANPRTFYGVPAGEIIKNIAILFRNGNGTVVQRNSDQSDMYVAIDPGSLDGKFIEPFFQPKFNPVLESIARDTAEIVRFRYVSNASATIRLFYDGMLVRSVNNVTELVDSFKFTTIGLHQIVGRVTDGTTTASDTLTFIAGNIETLAGEPAGIRYGINYEPGDTSVILMLHAPGKGRVSVIGDFNNWTESINRMTKTPDGNRFWLRITGLTPGTEYSFQYVVDDNLRIADPYTQKILDPANDQFITAATYPNLKAYPTGKTTGIVSVLQTAEPGYTWQVGNFNRPDKRGLVVYELLLRDFVATHDWKTLKDTLGYLKNLGINAIEVLPFNEFEGNISWGYNPSFYFAPDKYYGTKNRLKEFVDECHKQGIAVIMDIALNHSFAQSPMVQLYFDAANNRPDVSNPWFNPVTKHAFNVGYDMNHESLATRGFVSRVMEHWLSEYKLDGFRFDLSKGFTQNATCDNNGGNCNVAAWGNYDASRVAIWKRYYDSLQLKSPGSYVILEHFADDPEEKELSNYGMMFWGNLNGAFNEATMGYIPGSNFEGALHTVRGWPNPAVIAYMESHDEERLMYKNINFGNSSGTYNIKSLNTGLARNEMAAAFFFMMPGPKMIWQFGEMGYDYQINQCENGTINADCRTAPKPIKWDYLQVPARKHLYDVYAGLLKLRSNPLFKNGFVSNRVERSLAGGFKWLKLTTDTSNIVVVGNFEVSASTSSITFPGSGVWYDYLSGQTINATGSAQDITLQPGEYHVYLNRNVTNVLAPVTGITEVVVNGMRTSLSVYPNPVVRNATIEYELPENGRVDIVLVNLTGQQVAKLYSGYRVKGVYKLDLSSVSKQNLTTGTYFLQMRTVKNALVQKLVITNNF